MSFAEFGNRSSADVPEHNRLRGLSREGAHPQYEARFSALENAQAGVESFDYSAASNGSVTFPVAFAVAPVVTIGLLIGSNHDLILNIQGVTTTGFTFRLFQNSGSVVAGTADIHWMARAAS